VQWGTQGFSAPKKKTADLSALRFGRDDNFVVDWAYIFQGEMVISLQQTCHLDRSVA
jgi:hypothetical protein